jgi:hypothetical protein
VHLLGDNAVISFECFHDAFRIQVCL